MKNESSLDRVIRVVLALVFFVFGFYVFIGTLSVVAYALAIIMLVTAVTGFCALYRVFGINTNKK